MQVVATTGFTANQNLIVTSSYDNYVPENVEVKVWDPVTGELKHTFSGMDDVRALAILDGVKLVTGSDDNNAKIWNLETGICEHTLQGTVLTSNVDLTNANLTNANINYFESRGNITPTHRTPRGRWIVK